MLNSILLLANLIGAGIPNEMDTTVFKTVGLNEVTIVELKKSKRESRN